MDLQRWNKDLAAKMAAIVILTLGLFASIAAEGGWMPTFEPTLGTSKGGTRIRVHSTGSPYSLSDYFLQLGLNGETLTADHIGAINDTTVESQFVMPNIPSGMGTKGVVELSFSRSGDPYVDIGSFIFYDGDQMESEALSGPGKDGMLALNQTVFPESIESLDWNQIRPSCGFRDGSFTSAMYAVPHNNDGYGGSAELHIQCEEGASSISLNDQEFFPIFLPGPEKQARMAMEGVPTHDSASSGLAYMAYEEEIPRRKLSSGPVCTSTDTGMGLTITVTYVAPSYDLVNATVNNGITYIGHGGPISYLIRIIITMPGAYDVTSMHPACAGGSPTGTFNVSAAPSPSYSYVTTVFAPGGYTPGLPVPFNIRSADQGGISPSAQIQGPCPFSVNLKQLDPSSGISYAVPFTISSQVGGNWKVTTVPTRFLAVTGTITLVDTVITNGNISFSLKALTTVEVASTFIIKPDLNAQISVGPMVFSIDSQDVLPKYNLIHLISSKITAPSGAIVLQVLCDLERASVGCFYPLTLIEVGAYIIHVTIDGGTLLVDNVILTVIPGMVSGKKSIFSLVGMSSSNITQKIAGDTITASLTLRDDFGNHGNTSYILSGWNVAVTIALRNTKGGVVYMNVNAGLGNTTASVVVTNAGLYTATAYIGSSGNNLIGSNEFAFNVRPYTTSSSGFSGNIMVGKMVAGQVTPIWVILLDTYGNTIDGSTLSKSIVVIIHWNNLSLNTVNNGRIFELLPGINQTVASTKISIIASYGATQIATYNATCLPGPPDIVYTNITVSSQQLEVGANGTLLLYIMDNWGNLVDPSMNNFPFLGARLLRVQDIYGASYSSSCNLNYVHPKGTTTNPYSFKFTLPTIAASYFASIPLIGKTIESAPIIRVVASSPIGRMSTISGVTGIEPIPNSMYFVYVTPRDIYGNIWFGNASSLPITITGPMEILVPPSDITFSPHSSMASMLTFKAPNKTGLCTISVGGQNPDLTSTSISFQIIAGDFAAVSSEEVRQAVIGQYSSFFLVARDAFGYARDQSSIPSDRFVVKLCNHVSVTCGQATVNDRHLSGGRYLVTWSAPLVGTYTVDLYTPNGYPTPVTSLTVIQNPQTDKIVYYPRCNNAPPSLATCPQFFSVIAGEKISFKLAAYNEPVGGPYTTISSGGNLPAVFMTGGNIISLIDEGDGTYSLSFIATIATIANLTITNGVPTNISINVIPGRSSPIKSYFQLSYNLQSIYAAGSILSGGFWAVDSLGNQQDYNHYDNKKDKFQIVALNNNGEKIRGTNTFYYNSKGMYGAVMFLNHAGIYTLLATLNGYTIPILNANGHPLITINFIVNSGLPDIAAVSYIPSSMKLYGISGQVGITSMYDINDRFGNHIPSSSINCSSFILDKWFTPWQQTGCTTYDDHITYNWHDAYHAEDIKFQVKVHIGDDGIALVNPVTIAPSEPWPPTCSIITPNVITSTIGTKTTIDFRCRDKSNNVCLGDRSGQFSVVIARLGGSPYDTPMYASMGLATNTTNDGHYIAYFVLNLIGNFTAVLRLGDIRGVMIGQPIIVSSLPANVSVSLSFLSFIDSPKKILTTKVPTQIIAGALNQMKIVGVDVNGNLQDNSMCSNTTTPTVTITSDDIGIDGAGAGVNPFITNPVVIMDNINSNCIYLFNFTLTAVAKITNVPPIPATYTIHIQWTSKPNSVVYSNIAGSPFAFQVRPTPLDIQSSLLYLSSRSAGPTGLTSTFILQTKDLYGNRPSYTQSLIVSATVAPTGTNIPHSRRLLENTMYKSSNHINYDIDTSYKSSMSMDASEFFLLISPTIINNLDTTYSISFTVIKAETYDLFIYINEQLFLPISGSIATIPNCVVSSGTPDVSRVRPIGIGINDGATLAVGSAIKLTISLCDIFGNPVSIANAPNLQTRYMNGISSASTITIFRTNIGNNTLAISSSNVIETLFSISGGSIIFSCIPTMAGLMNINLAYNDNSGSNTVTSVLGPYHLFIISNESASPSTFHVFGPGINAAPMCEDDLCATNTMYVKITDMYNNLLFPDITLCQNFSIVGWNPSLMIGFTGKPIYDNYCAISWKLLPGTPPSSVIFNVNYTNFDGTIHAILADSHVTTVDGSGFKFTVPILLEVVDPDPDKCLAFGDLGGLMMAGTSGRIIVQLVDSSGIALQTSPSTTNDFVQLSILATNHIENPPLSPTVNSIDNGDGTFLLQYDTIRTGTFTILILVGFLNKPLGGRSIGYSLKVVAAPSVIESTVVLLVSNSTTYRAGKDHVQIQVQAVDNFLNLQDHILSQVDGFQVRILQPDNTIAIIPLNRHQQISTETGNLYVYWSLDFLPLQANKKSVYSFNIIWRNDTTEIFIPTMGLMIPTVPGPLSSSNIKVLGSGSAIAIVGQLSTFSILLYDSFNNPISEIQDLALAKILATLSLGGNLTTIQANCTISITPPSIVCHYFASIPGHYGLNIYSATTKLTMLSVIVEPGFISGPNCLAFGDGVGTSGVSLFPGEPTTFNILAYDLVNNTILEKTAYFEVKGENVNQSGVLVPQNGFPKYISENTFEVQYTPLRAGIYNLFVKRANVDIAGSPYQIAIQTGRVAPNCILDEQSLNPCVIMSIKNITLWSRDAYGNIRANEQDVFHIFTVVDGYPHLGLVDIMAPLGGGAYGFSFPCLNDTFIQVINDAVLVYSGKIFTLVGPPDPRHTTLSLDDAFIPVGKYGHGLIVTRDFAGHQLKTGQQSLFINYGGNNGHENGTMMVIDRGDGTYDLSYIVLIAGIYQLQGTLNEYWPFYDGLLIVTPSAPHTAAVYFDPFGYVVGTAGIFQIQYFDEYQNNITDSSVLDSSTLRLFCMSWDVPSRSALYSAANFGIQFNSTTGFFTITFQPTMAGNIFVNLKVGGVDVLDGGYLFSANVDYLPPVASNFDIWGAGFEFGAVKGENTYFYVRVRDALGTIIPSEPDDIFDVHFTPELTAPWGASSTFLSNGVTMFTYSPIYDSYTMLVNYGGKQISDPVTLLGKDTALLPSIRDSVVLGPDTSEVSTSVPLIYTVAPSTTSLKFTIQPRDQDGIIITTPNPNYIGPNFTVTVGNRPPFEVVNQLDGWWYEFTIPLQVQTGNLYVEVSGLDNGVRTYVKNSGFTLYLVPTTSNAANTQIVRSTLDFNGITQVIAGQSIEITVQPYDLYKNSQIYNLYVPDIFSATLHSISCGDVIGQSSIGLNNGDFTYTMRLKPKNIGQYNVIVNLGKERCFNYEILVTASNLWLPSMLMVNSVDPMQVDVPIELLISASDMYQNPIKDPGDIYCTFQNNVTYAKYNTMVVASNDTDGQFWIYFTPIKAGHYHIIVGDALGRNGGPTIILMEVDVWPGIVSLDLTRTSVLTQIFEAGQLEFFTIVALDAKSNPNYTIPSVRISYENAEVDALVTSPCSVNPTIGVSQDGPMWCMPNHPEYTSYVTFTPTSYGKVNITIEWDFSTIITYYYISIHPSTRPIALNAKLSQNLGSIVVKFDIPTDAGHVSFEGLASTYASGWQRCNNTLDSSLMEKIGTNPNCIFEDSTTMIIQLGYNADMRSLDSGGGDNVSIANGIYNRGDTSNAVIGWVPLGIMDTFPIPHAILNGPHITSVCDDLILDASSSSGAIGRPLHYEYNVKGTTNLIKLANLERLLQSMSLQMVITINAGQLDPDQSYTFSVTVTNYLGMSNTAKHIVQTVRTSVPQVSIRDHVTLLNVMRWDTIELEADAHLANLNSYQPDGTCGQSGKVKIKKMKPPIQTPLMYEWSPTSSSFLNQDAIGWNARCLSLPGNMLQPNIPYSFQVKVWPQGSPQLLATTSISIQSISSPLAVVIVGGNRVVNITEDLYVEAAIYDPDDSVELGFDQPHPFEISWNCDNIILNDHFDSTLYPDVTGSIKRVLLIKSSWMTLGTNYTFTVTVARAPYTDSSRIAAKASAIITPIEDVMTVVASVNNEAEVRTYGASPARLLKIMCSPGLGFYNWEVTSEADPRTGKEMQLMKLDEHTLRIDPLTLIAGATYTFTCIAKSPIATGSGSIVLSTLLEPSGGTVDLIVDPPNTNLAGTTSYSLRAYGWTPGGNLVGTLKYEFRYIIMDSQGSVVKEFIIQPPSTANYVNDVYVLPGMVVFRVYIINPGLIRFMPNDAPYGAIFEFSPMMVRKNNQRRRLLTLPTIITNYYDFAKKGMYYRALVSIDSYAITTFPNPAGGCGGGGNKKVIMDMMKTIEINDPQYPVASQGNAVQSGSGPYIAVLVASIYSRLVERPGNLNLDEFKTSLRLYLQKLEKVAMYGIKVPTLYGNPCDHFLNAGDAFVKAVKLKCFKSSTQAQALMDRASIIPIWLAEMIYQDVSFVSPTTFVRPTYTVSAISFKLPEHPYTPFGGPTYLIGQMRNFYITIAVTKGGGQEFGITLASFNKFSPLSASGMASLNHDKKFVQLMVVFDVLVVGLTPGDFLSLTITGTWTDLLPIGKGFAYKAIQIDKTGTANTTLLQNIVPMVTGVSFNLVGSYSRIALIKVKADKNFTPIGWHGIHEKYKPPKQPKKMNTTIATHGQKKNIIQSMLVFSKSKSQYSERTIWISFQRIIVTIVFFILCL